MFVPIVSACDQPGQRDVHQELSNFRVRRKGAHNHPHVHGEERAVGPQRLHHRVRPGSHPLFLPRPRQGRCQPRLFLPLLVQGSHHSGRGAGRDPRLRYRLQSGRQFLRQGVLFPRRYRPDDGRRLPPVVGAGALPALRSASRSTTAATACGPGPAWAYALASTPSKSSPGTRTPPNASSVPAAWTVTTTANSPSTACGNRRHLILGASDDPYRAVEDHTAVLEKEYGLKLPAPRERNPDWWSTPIFCGWGEQMSLGFRDHGNVEGVDVAQVLHPGHA